MTRQRKNLLLVVLSIVLAFACFVSVMPIGNKTVSADTSYNMIAGAQARKADDGTAGLRFVSYMDASAYADTDALSYGMLIAPLDYIQDAEKGELTKESVFGTSATYCVDPACDKKCGKHIINLTSDALVDVTDEVKKAQGESYVEGTQFKGFKGVILDIKEANYLRKFVGVAYIKDATDPENVDYTFATTDQEENARSVAYVAKKSLDTGVEDTANGCLANYVAKSYEAIEFDANVTGIALNETIVAEGTFEKGEQSVDAGEVTVAIKSGLEAYQYVGNKVLSGKAIGKEITVTLSAKSSDGAYTYTKDVTAVVDANGYEVVDDVIIGLNRADEDKAIAGASGDLAIYVNAEKVADVADTYNTSIFTEDGYQVVYAEGTSGKFVFDAEVYDYAIGTKAEFKAWYENANFDNLSAVLTADVDLADAYLTKNYTWDASGNSGYASTFDGKGHILSMSGNGFVYGLFPYVAKTGVIKNLIFEGLRTYASTNSSGIFSTIMAGTLENVYITAIRTASATATTGSHWGFARNISAGAEISGVVFIITSDSVTGSTYTICNYAAYRQPNGLYVVAPNGTAGNFNTGNLNGSNWKGFTSTADFATYCNGKLPAGLSADFYTLDKETGLPIPIKLFERDYTTVLADQIVGLNKTGDVKVDFGVANAGATAKVTVDGIAFGDYTVDEEGFITFARVNFTEEGIKALKVKLYNDNNLLTGIYAFNVETYDYAIGTKAEFEAWYTNANFDNLSAVLTADVDLANAYLTKNYTWDDSGNSGYASTFDGKGHILSMSGNGFVYGLFPYVAKTGVIKNLIFEGLRTYASTNSSGIFSTIMAGTLENVYITAIRTASATATTGSHWGFARNISAGAEISGVVFIITSDSVTGSTYTICNYAAYRQPNGLYVVAPNGTAGNFNTGNLNGSNWKGFTSTADFATYCNGALPAGLSSDFYTMDEATGLPIAINLANKQAQA